MNNSKHDLSSQLGYIYIYIYIKKKVTRVKHGTFTNNKLSKTYLVLKTSPTNSQTKYVHRKARGWLALHHVSTVWHYYDIHMNVTFRQHVCTWNYQNSMHVISPLSAELCVICNGSRKFIVQGKCDWLLHTVGARVHHISQWSLHKKWFDERFFDVTCNVTQLLHIATAISVLKLYERCILGILKSTPLHSRHYYEF